MFNYDLAALIALLTGTLFILAGGLLTIAYLCKAKKNGEEPVKALVACDVIFHFTITLGFISFCICALIAIFGLYAKQEDTCGKSNDTSIVIPMEEPASIEGNATVADESDTSALVQPVKIILTRNITIQK